MPMTTSTQSSLVASAINGLGLDLQRSRALTSPEENGLLSPYSIQLALAMTYAGAAGETREEMRSVLHYPEDEAELHAGLAELTARLEGAAERLQSLEMELGGKRPGTAPLELYVASRLFGRRSGALLSSFLGFVERHYGAPFEELDVGDDPEAARATVNRWVEESTGGMIRELVPPGRLDSTTRLVLASALYLRAAWSEPFSERSTEPMPFLVRGSERVLTPTMTQTEGLGFARNDGYVALALPYVGELLQLLVLLPDAPDGLVALERELTVERLGSCARLPRRRVRLWLPKFRLSPPGADLAAALRNMGMTTAFDEPEDSADFSRMAPRTSDDYVAMSAVLHAAEVDVSEEGTRASAVSAAFMRLGAAGGRPPRPIEVHVDHPFLFAIQETQSGACLMLGRVSDPR
jgi:serpin B